MYRFITFHSYRYIYIYIHIIYAACMVDLPAKLGVFWCKCWKSCTSAPWSIGVSSLLDIIYIICIHYIPHFTYIYICNINNFFRQYQQWASCNRAGCWLGLLEYSQAWSERSNDPKAFFFFCGFCRKFSNKFGIDLS